MSDSAASDDSDLRNIVHPGTPLVATALALAEKLGRSGEEVLTAIVLGYEAQARIGSALTPEFRDAGYHGCIIAVFGSTVAACRLLGLDEDRMTHAIALAATSIGGMMAAANTSWSREYHAGLATLLGIEAALAAEAGFTGEERILEMPKGFIALHGGGDAALATAGMGDDWMILREIAIKMVPGAHQYHASAEAAANAAIAGNVAPEDVEQIIVSRPGVRSSAGRVHPKDLIDMAHSAAYFVAAGVADRDFSWAHATPEKINDPIIAALLRQRRRRPGADHRPRPLQAGRYGDDPHEGRPGAQRHRLRAEGLRRPRRQLVRHRRQVPGADAGVRLEQRAHRGGAGCDQGAASGAGRA